MIPAPDNPSTPGGEATSPLAGRLELLLQHAITLEQFESDMVRACRSDPEEIWTLLALLDQHHRLGQLPTELFRALKASAARYGLVRREPYTQSTSTAARTAAAPPPPPRAPEAPVPPASARTAPSPPPVPTPQAPDTTTTPPVPPPAAGAEPPIDTPEPAAPTTLSLGSVLVSRYRLEAELDSDDRGRNFQALDLQHAGQPPAVCQVALHCMQPKPEEFETTLAERRTEFQIAQPLAHPNILTVRELDQDGRWILLTTNFMRGETLAALLARRLGDALPRTAALTIIRELGAALSYSHEHGVVHGDLQPQNVLISPAGELRVRGFGAQRADSSYASCEQLEGRAPDRRDDLYALACISYELLHGSHPFNRLNAATARGRGLTPGRPIKLSGKQWRALRVGLAWRREGRHLSVERYLARIGVAAAPKRLPTIQNLMEMPAPRRSWLGVILGIVILAAAIAGVVYFEPSLTRISSPPDWRALRDQVVARFKSAPKPNAVATPAPQPTPAEAPPAAPATVSPPATAPVMPTTTSEAATASPLSTPAPPATVAAPSVSATPPPAPAPPAAIAAPPPAPAKVATPVAPAKIAAAAPAAAAPAIAGPARVGLSADHYAVQSGDSAARIVVRRSGAAKQDAQFVWWTENASAQADQDFVSWGRRVEHIPAGQNSATLLVPIIQDATRTSARTFYVIIGETADGAKVDGVTRAAVLLPGHH